ncbi:hypothetical protein Q9299_05160 [Gemmobacter fulvus]|uniref:phage tail terminator protein n=1 Tax=Gemmobacter fulvus TaxID=2840474 RepID=UPI0027964495|nr:hypothetical protein [Gemmobacter fulvus]MDQ1847671.1 hypothetical protein [Gemmobacter fulvus]
MTPAIIERLKAEIPALQRRVYGAAALAAIMKVDGVPTVTPCAHVLPTGLQGHPQPSVATGAYVQSIDYGFAVVISLRAHDPNGERMALDEVQPLLEAVATALAGWKPAPTVGVMIFRRAVLASFARGVAIYELDFSLQHQLRIAR